MNKKCFMIAFLACILITVSACASTRGGASDGGAPRTSFLGGTSGLIINFEKDSPPPEVTDDETFDFNVIVSLKNDGEAFIERNDVKVNLVGFDPADFGHDFDSLMDAYPDDNLDPKRRDAEGNIVEGTTTFVTFPKNGDSFIPTKFQSNTEFTFRADVCYNYETRSNTKLCVLKNMINVVDDQLCKPTGSKEIFMSSGPVQIANFRQAVQGKDKISFSFDVVLSGNVDIFWSEDQKTPASSNFEGACPRTPRDRRKVENQVGIEITEIPVDPVVTSFRCGGLDNGADGVVKLINGKRTITCTAEFVVDRTDVIEKTIGIKLKYNVLDTKETKVLIKHLSDESDFI